MPITILKIIQPYLIRYLAKRTADYLEERRQRRLNPPEEKPPVSAPEPRAYPPPQALASSGEAFWYTMSGVLLGSAFGFILAYLTRPEG